MVIYLNLGCVFFNETVNILFELPVLAFLPHSPFPHSGGKIDDVSHGGLRVCALQPNGLGPGPQLPSLHDGQAAYPRLALVP